MKKIYFFLFVSMIFSAALTREERLSMRAESPPIISLEVHETMSIEPPYFNDFEEVDPDWTILNLSGGFTECQWQQVFSPETIEVAPDIFPSRVDFPEERLDFLDEAYLPSARGGRGCFWYGNPESGTFIGEPYTGGVADDGGLSLDGHEGWLISPEILSSELEHIQLSFWTWWEVECIDIDEYDLMTVNVSTDGGITWAEVAKMNPPFSRLFAWFEWESYTSGGYLLYGRWVQWNLSLDDYIGENINIGFHFQTVDGLYNGFRGWLIDDFSISGSGGHSELEGIDSLVLVNCRPEPDTLELFSWIENIGDVIMYNTQVELFMPSVFSIISGDNPRILGDLDELERATATWEVTVDTTFARDTSFTFEVVYSTRHPAGSYHDNFDDSTPLFTGSGSGTDRWDYTNASAPGGPTAGNSGLGIAGIPVGATEYGEGINETLTSSWLNLTGFDACYVSFFYWMNVPDVGSLFDMRTIDGGFFEMDNGSGWVVVDEFAIGAIQPRYDEYLDDLTGNPLGGQLAWSLPRWSWTKVQSQDLMRHGYCSPGDLVRFRFRFGSSSFDAYPQGQGWFIDDFHVGSEGFSVGPFVSYHTVFIPGSSVPEFEFFYPWQGAYSSCEDQNIGIGISGYTGIDESRLSLTVNGVEYTIEDDELVWDNPEIYFQPSEYYENDCTVFVFLDSLYTDLGCGIEPLQWFFFIDITPPDIQILSPAIAYVADPFENFVFLITDAFSGVNTETIYLRYNEIEYELSHPALTLLGDTLVFDPTQASTSMILDTIIYVGASDSPDFCEANANEQAFVYVWGEPSILPIYPENGVISSCEFQEIRFIYNDIVELNHSSIVVAINEDVFDYSSEEINIYGDTIIFIPQVPFRDSSFIVASVIEAQNIYGIDWDGEAQISFFIDLQPPIALLTDPNSLIVPNRVPDLSLTLTDNLAGIESDSIILFVNDEQVSFTVSGDDFQQIIDFVPSNPYPSGDTVYVSLVSCDMAELCGGNCSVMDTFFIISPETACESWPNPFTPNDDGYGDYILFSYPDQYFSDAELIIFDTRSVEVFRKEIGYEEGRFLWDGFDSGGQKAANGLYIYLIAKDNGKLCEGTIVLIR